MSQFHCFSDRNNSIVMSLPEAESHYTYAIRRQQQSTAETEVRAPLHCLSLR